MFWCSVYNLAAPPPDNDNSMLHACLWDWRQKTIFFFFLFCSPCWRRLCYLSTLTWHSQVQVKVWNSWELKIEKLHGLSLKDWYGFLAASRLCCSLGERRGFGFYWFFFGFMRFNCVCGNLYSTLRNIMIWQVRFFFFFFFFYDDLASACRVIQEVIKFSQFNNPKRGNAQTQDVIVLLLNQEFAQASWY